MGASLLAAVCGLCEALFGRYAPVEEDPQVGLGVLPGLAAVAAQVGRHRGTQDELIGMSDTDIGSRKASHT
jgi:hypothetical protein